MKNQYFKQVSKNTLFLIALCIGFAIAFTACTQEKSKEEVLMSASKLDSNFADSVISTNSVKGFADDDKGRKDSLVLIADALKEYKYDDVIKLSNDYFTNYEVDENVKYMLATALFQRGDYGKAAKHYIPLLSSSSFKEKKMAKYYLALCNMRFDSKSGTATAIKYLKELKSEPGDQFSADQLQGLIDVCS